MNAQLPILGVAYQHLDQYLTNQTLKNWYVELNRDTAKPISLQPFPGWSQFGYMAGDAGGCYEWKGVGYKVVGTTLYSVATNGAYTSIGTISGSGQCEFVSTFSELVIVRSGNVYSYDGATLTTATDADFETPNYVTFINQQAVYDGDSNRFCVSDAGTLTSINGLNFATVETKAGLFVRPYVFGEIIYMFCDKYAVQWYNSGVGNPPVDKIINASMLVGLKEGHAIDNNKTYMYWFGSDSALYRTIAGQPEQVSTVPLTREFRTYDTAGLRLNCFSFRGQEFVCLYFPQEQRTWVFNEAGGWFELTYKNTEIGVPITDFVNVYDKDLIEIGGGLYELDDDLFQANGEYMIKERVSDTITAAALFGSQYAGKYVEYNKVTVTAKIVGILDTETYLILGYSDDNGDTFTDINISAGELSGHQVHVFELNDLGSSIERVFRLRVSDNVRCSIHGGSMEVFVGV